MQERRRVVMKKSQWTDEEIEQLFSELPIIKDQRTPELIFARVQQVEKKKWNVHRLFPVMAAATALFIFAIITSSLFLKKDASKESKELANSPLSEERIEVTTDNKQSSDEKVADIKTADENKSTTAEEPNTLMKQAAEEVAHSIAFQEDVENKITVTLGVPDLNINNIVPVTLVVDGEENKDQVSLIKETMEKIDEASLGLEDFYPLKEVEIKPSEKQTELVVDVRPGHPYGSSATESIFMEALKETARNQGFDTIRFTTNGKEGAEFSHTGYTPKIEVNEGSTKRAYLLYQANVHQKKLLVPTISHFDTIEAAIEEMKKPTDSSLIYPSLPKWIHIDSIKTEGHRLVLTFSDDTKLNNSEEVVKGLEAILLTAKEFGYKSVVFQNSQVDKIGKITLNGENSVIVYPNYVKE